MEEISVEKATGVERAERISIRLSRLESEAVLGSQNLDLHLLQGALGITDVDRPRSNDDGDVKKDGDQRIRDSSQRGRRAKSLNKNRVKRNNSNLHKDS